MTTFEEFKALRDRVKHRPQRTVDLVLDDDLRAQHRTAVEVLQDAARAEQAAQTRVDLAVEQKQAAGTVKAARAEHEAAQVARATAADAVVAVEAEMKSSVVTVVLEALSSADWTSLVGACPPRKDNKDDEAMGYDTSVFFPALVKASVVGPFVATDDEESWTWLYDMSTDAMFTTLAETALVLNRREDGKVPFSAAVSALTSGSGASSTKRDASA